MSSTPLALSLAGGAASACSPIIRCPVATSSALNAYTKSPLVVSNKFLVFPSSSSSTAAGGSCSDSDKMMTTSQLPLGCYCYSTAPTSVLTTGRGWRRRSISCEVGLRSPSSALSSSSTAVTEGEEEEEEERQRAEKKIGAKVRVKVPLKVYHVPRVPEVDLTGKEGHLKEYVGVWKGKRISANLPYKIEFVADIEGRGPVKFFSHLKEDEFEYLD